MPKLSKLNELGCVTGVEGVGYDPIDLEGRSSLDEVDEDTAMPPCTPQPPHSAAPALSKRGNSLLETTIRALRQVASARGEFPNLLPGTAQ